MTEIYEVFFGSPFKGFDAETEAKVRAVKRGYKYYTWGTWAVAQRVDGDHMRNVEVSLLGRNVGTPYKEDVLFSSSTDGVVAWGEALEGGWQYFTWGAHHTWWHVSNKPVPIAEGSSYTNKKSNGNVHELKSKHDAQVLVPHQKESPVNKKIVMFFDETCPPQEPEFVGNKAANLIRMKADGLPIPEGFVLPTQHTFDTEWIYNGGDIGPGFPADHDLMIRSTAAVRFAADLGSREWASTTGAPYLVSVRSGAPVSMPGMMDTVLNVGLNGASVSRLSEATNEKFALDSYRRLIEMFSTTVDGLDGKRFKEVYNAAVELNGELNEKALHQIVAAYLDIYSELTDGQLFPQNPDEQLRRAINAVYCSWFSERAIAYRTKAGISGELGTAVTVQGMRFGNLNDSSATGVVFSRNPDTGENVPYGEFLVNAQGEDVVAGTHNARPINQLGTVKELFQASVELTNWVKVLDEQFEGIVDIEFTIEDGKLWILQCRKGKTTPQAKLHFLLDQMVSEVLASSSSQPTVVPHYVQAINEVFAEITPVKATAPEAKAGKVVGQGQGASQGIATGRAAFTPEDVEQCKADKQQYIWIAPETTPDDTPQMLDAAGILTSTGSSVSHAAVCAREWGLPCVVGFEDMTFTKADGCVINEDVPLKAGDLITINGTTGKVMLHD